MVETNLEPGKKESLAHSGLNRGWFLAAFGGLIIGALGTFLPFYFHALNDWDLSDKTTLLPREMPNIILFYYPYWIGGAIVGAAIGVAIFAGFKKLSHKNIA